jgi:hypothetical protein
VIDKIIKKIGGWRGKLLNVRSRLILLQSCIASISMHLLAVIKFPKWALNMINSQMSNFLWDDTEDGRKYHLANWDLVCLKKEFGGLGVQNLQDYNLCLLASWIRRYHLDTNKIWRQIVDSKYDLTPNILCAAPQSFSPFWKGVMWAANAAKLGYRWNLGNGLKILFWTDIWLGNCSLAILYWDLFILVHEQEVTVAQAWDSVNLRFTFRRCVSRILYDRWLELIQLVSTVNLNNDDDMPIWMLESSGQYNVRSFYAVVNDRGVVPVHTPAIWQLDVLPRLHVFLWLLANDKLLTRNNLAKRRHVDDLTCLFFSDSETCRHLFFDCFVAKLVWSGISDLLNVSVGSDFESVARWWLSNKKNTVINVVCTATLWSI